MALALWFTVIAVQVVKGGRWAWSLQYILLSSPIAIVTTIFLCRFRVARKKPVSYGTLLAGPFGSSLLVILCYRFYYNGWSIFTSSYWHNLKGGWDGVLWELALVGGVSVLPAIAIVLYYQRRSKTNETPVDEQHRTAIPEGLIRSWRWAIELFCSILLLLFWILRFGGPEMNDLVILINFGSCIMLLLLVTSLPSFRHHWRHGLFGLVVFFAWFVTLFCYPPL